MILDPAVGHGLNFFVPGRVVGLGRDFDRRVRGGARAHSQKQEREAGEWQMEVVLLAQHSETSYTSHSILKQSDNVCWNSFAVT